VVACLAASTNVDDGAKITSTCMRTSSAASALRPLPFDDDVGALDVAEVTQARPQPLTCGTLEGKAQKPDARWFRTLLRTRRERPSGRAADESEELAPPHGGYPRPGSFSSWAAPISLRKTTKRRALSTGGRMSWAH
jgi:hypothetical protein